MAHLEDFLSPAALENANAEFVKNNEEFESRVKATTAKRLKNNLAQGVK